MRVAVLGVGRMGTALARRLLAREHTVRVWNRTRGRTGELVRAGAEETSSPEAAARDADAVLMTLTDDRACRDVLTRLAAHMGPDPPVVVDMSTVSPDTARELREMTPEHRFVAAPVVGGPAALAAGQAMGLLSGDREVMDRIRSLWPDVFSVQWYCGEDPGAGLIYKVLNNHLLMSGVALLSEVVATGQAAGLDERMMQDFLYQWPTVAPGVHNRLDDIFHGDHEGWFTTRLGAKDLRLVIGLARSLGLDLPIARTVERRYEEAAASGWGDADIGAVVELLRAEHGPGRPGNPAPGAATPEPGPPEPEPPEPEAR
ncbi:NAD(P)-dependent oxidoreductase [Streptosporangium sp. NPDC004379]|uniref:NAD(P)-dependent oxidoreductase n=1 Tax=Streptosporangium sp. NPDC004379 TaxID=3366189 RepID=UPI003685B4E9